MNRTDWIQAFRRAFRRYAGFSFDELGDTGALDTWRDSYPDEPERAADEAAREYTAAIEDGDWLWLE